MCKTRFGSQGVIPDVFLQDFVFEKTLMAREIPPPPSWGGGGGGKFPCFGNLYLGVLANAD